MAATTTVVWNDSWLKAACLAAHPPAVKATAEEAARKADWRHVANSVGADTSTPSGGITVGASDWKRLEFGTRPHHIEPTKRMALRFADGGFSETANHPGQAAHPFIRPVVPHYIDHYRMQARARLPHP